MRATLLVVACVAALATLASADVYMHNMRGSNNRLNEANAERNNGNRLFDSQNNNRGGYNVGDKYNQANTNQQNPDGLGQGNTPVSPTAPFYGPDPAWASAQYSMVYLEGSDIEVEWTAQHGCSAADGVAGVNNCNYVLQYTCDTDPAQVTDQALQVLLRDGGVTTGVQPPTATPTATGLATITTARNQNNGVTADQNGNTQQLKGRHENEFSYWECLTRSRDRFLFAADNNLQGTTARYTRQNPNGARSGLECPEERDYYPYWGPTIWRDIAYLTDNTTLCDSLILPNSQNHNYKYKCVDPTPGTQYPAALYAPIFPDLCTASVDATTSTAGQWKGFRHNLPPPHCGPAPTSTANHLGNADGGLEPARYKWKLPTVDALRASGVQTYHGDRFARCVMRLRYNISTADFNPWTTTSRSNGPATSLTSPVTQNPVIDVGLNNFHDYNADGTLNPLAGLRLAVDTDQFGRTFQDRSHVFYIHRRNTTTVAPTATVHNLNVRGKRGNIVQTYPAVEYDFIPAKLAVSVGDFVHVQWTGSNTHNNGGGGDGQGGDAGQGTGGTDRSNFVQMANVEDSFPLPQDKMAGASMFGGAVSECFDLRGNALAPLDCTVALATGGHYRSTAEALATYATRPFGPLMNTSPASFVDGVLVRFKAGASGKAYPYMCTRNNSFSNRSQKGVILVA